MRRETEQCLGAKLDRRPGLGGIVDLVARSGGGLEARGRDLVDRAHRVPSREVSQRLGQSAGLDDWLPPLLAGKRRLDAVAPEALTQALQNRLGWEGQQRLDRIAPARFETPAGSSHPIDYAAEGGPAVEVRVQALFGLAEHPEVGGVPLVLSLTSPAGRPIQTTRDLPGFWAGSWAAVAKEMRGRYPRHPWPDDPAAASATLRTKNADARAAGKR
jgi:ATP-dependent helicase HrpB